MWQQPPHYLHVVYTSPNITTFSASPLQYGTWSAPHKRLATALSFEADVTSLLHRRPLPVRTKD
jgi:hypothetical protein